MQIGEVARRSGVSARMLRHYESLGLVTPSGRSSAGYRDYSADDITRILHVESLRTLGLSLREIGQALDDPTLGVADVARRLIDETQARIDRDRDLLERLRQVESVGPQDWDQVLSLVSALVALESETPAARHRAALTVDDAPGDALARAFLAEDDPGVAGALRWALVRHGASATPALTDALRSSEAGVRRRAIAALTELPGEDAATAVHGALCADDPQVRAHAALGLAERGETSSISELVAMVVSGLRDVDAADALAALALRDGQAPVAESLVRALDTADADARRRIAQALADVPGPVADQALIQLSDDADQATAVTARYLRQLRAT